MLKFQGKVWQNIQSTGDTSRLQNNRRILTQMSVIQGHDQTHNCSQVSLWSSAPSVGDLYQMLCCLFKLYLFKTVLIIFLPKLIILFMACISNKITAIVFIIKIPTQYLNYILHICFFHLPFTGVSFPLTASFQVEIYHLILRLVMPRKKHLRNTLIAFQLVANTT